MIRSVLLFIYGLILLMVVRMVMQWIGRVFGGQARSGRPGPNRAQRSGAVGRPSARDAEDLVQDPVCQTYVPRSRALPATIDGRAELFCSEACREKARSAVPSAS